MRTEDFGKRDHLSEVSSAMLQRYYVLVKQKILGPDDSIHPFFDTLREFYRRKEIREKLGVGTRCSELSEFQFRDLLYNQLLDYIKKD